MRGKVNMQMSLKKKNKKIERAESAGDDKVLLNYHVNSLLKRDEKSG